MDIEIAPAPTRGDISVRDIAADLKAARWPILAVMLILGVAGGAFGKLRTKQYESIIIVAPVTSDSGHMGGLGAIASQYGDIASMAGVSTPSSSKKSEAVAVLQSELLTEAYIRQHNLLPVLKATPWLPFLANWHWRGKPPEPTLWKANQFFKKNVRSVTEDKATSLITLKISWRDPKVAAQWANDLVKITNVYLRDKAIREAERNINYLNEQASKTGVLEARQAIYSLLKDELDNEMLARGREEYALKVIDPAFAPEVPASFGGTVMAILGLVTGLIVSVMVVLGRRVYRNSL